MHVLRFWIIFIAVICRAEETPFVPFTPAGQTFAHDPSTIIRTGGKYFNFGTGPGIRAKSSPDLIQWRNEPPVFAKTPAWARDVAPGFDDFIWAPDVVRVNDQFFLFYSVSAWGKQTSAIGLATNDPASTNLLWRDAGEIIRSTNGDAFNTIDPSAFLDDDGKLWLAFGSYWQGIFLIELDPRTGKRIDGSQARRLAWNDSIEAACLTRHGKFYYLFVNWGQCCRGTNSTYEVRVGRAEKITGPYLDRAGRDLTTGGGSPFLASSGRFIGPGHIAIVDDGAGRATDHFSFHYYDADARGRSRLALGKIDWSDGWPVAVGDTNLAGKQWKLVWADEFNTNGAPNPANWDYEQGFVRNEELQWYQRENVYCTNGLLIIEARREQKPNPLFSTNRGGWRAQREHIEYTSASITTRKAHQFKYGKFEMCARIDTRSGSWPAFWTLGAGRSHRWPACGEIDITEFYTNSVLANFAWQKDGNVFWRSNRTNLTEFGERRWASSFHIWTMEWDEQKIDLLLDGQLMNRLLLSDADDADEGNPFHRPMYLILNQAIGGLQGGDPSDTDFPVRFEVDWVRVCQR